VAEAFRLEATVRVARLVRTARMIENPVLPDLNRKRIKPAFSAMKTGK
jgi:hypothetical protein